MSIGEHLLAFFLSTGCAQALSGSRRFTRIQDVQMAAAAAEGDDLPAEGANHVHVVRFQITQNQRQSAEPRATGRHSADQCGLAQAGQAEHEN
ncbi:hypothetical protein IWX78_003194 [Mycetocola sp. CAN_C7]